MAIFERRHYQAIAEELGRCHRSACDPCVSRTIVCLAYDLASMFSADDPNFKRERFLKACGMEEG